MSAQESSIRAGVFSTVAAADRAVEGLMDAGFSEDQIVVVCSEEAARHHFEDFKEEEPAGSETPRNVATGGVIGAALGGLAVVTGAALTGGTALLATAGLAAWTGGVFGGLAGAMVTRGVEDELADFYEQAVQEGKILVAAEAAKPDAASLVRAEEVLHEAGAEPIAVPKE